jgi:hypothetical protein
METDSSPTSPCALAYNFLKTPRKTRSRSRNMFAGWAKKATPKRADDDSGNQGRLLLGREISGGDLYERVQKWSPGQYHGAASDSLCAAETIGNLLSWKRNAIILSLDDSGASKRRH